jgi:hypothetical protein
MREARITLPELSLIAGTRAVLGAGLGLLLADRLSEGTRRAFGWTLFLIGAVSTVPLALDVLGHRLDAGSASPNEGSQSGDGRPGGGRGRLRETRVLGNAATVAMLQNRPR